MSAYRTAIACVVIALVAGVSGCTSGTSPTESETAASGLSDVTPSEGQPTAGSAAGKVQVTVVDLEGSQGGSLAGTLFVGLDVMTGDQRVIGGFGVPVDADPFTTTQTINTPGEEFQGLFPYVTGTPLLVEPGTYTLFLWAAPDPLTPFGRWSPDGGIAGLRGCLTTLEAAAGSGATITVNGIPEWGGDVTAKEAKCNTG